MRVPLGDTQEMRAVITITTTVIITEAMFSSSTGQTEAEGISIYLINLLSILSYLIPSQGSTSQGHVRLERTLEAILDGQPCRSWERDLATPSASSHLLPSFAPYVPAKPIFYFLNKLPQGLCTCSFLYWMNPGSPRLTWLASALHGDFELECHLP